MSNGNKYWKAKVCDVRQDNRDRVWIEVKWFYSKNDLLSDKEITLDKKS